MKALILALFLVPQLGWSKVSDFGQLIRENNAAQKQLHKQLKTAQGWDDSTKKSSPKKEVLETTVADYSPKTKKSMLVYKKEKVTHSPSYKKQMHRVADEMNSIKGEL